jgi:hypothetical protein
MEIRLKEGTHLKITGWKQGNGPWQIPSKAWKTVTAGPKEAKTMDYGMVANILNQLMPDVQGNLPTPDLKIANQPRANWDGKCEWTYGTPNSIIILQKRICAEEASLRRIIAHELCHHEQYLVHWSKVPKDSFKLFTSIEGGHGKTFREIANRWNAKYGKDFVTEKSDESYVREYDEKPFYVFMHSRIMNNRPTWQTSTRLTDKQRKFMVRKLQGEYKLVQTTDHRFVHAPVIGSPRGWQYIPPGDHDWAESAAKVFNQPDLRMQWTPPPPATEEERVARDEAERKAYYDELMRKSEEFKQKRLQEEALRRKGLQSSLIGKVAFIPNDLVWLKDYLTMSDVDKGKELAREIPEFFGEFLQNKGWVPPEEVLNPYTNSNQMPLYRYVKVKGGWEVRDWKNTVLGKGKTKQQAFNAWTRTHKKTVKEEMEEQARLSDMDLGERLAEDYDLAEQIYPLVPDDLYEEFLKDGGDWMHRNDPTEAPSFLHMGFERIVRNQWLVHYTNNPDDIAYNGFTIGMDDLTKLGITTWFTDKGKPGGYNYGVPADQARKIEGKYGKHAVIFRASGIEVYHYGDEERQTIFWGEDARDIVPIYNHYGKWSVVDGMSGRTIFENEDVQAVVDWVVANFNQYRRTLNPGPRKKMLARKPVSAFVNPLLADSHKYTPWREDVFYDLDEGEGVQGYSNLPECVDGSTDGLSLKQLSDQEKINY